MKKTKVIISLLCVVCLLVGAGAGILIDRTLLVGKPSNNELSIDSTGSNNEINTLDQIHITKQNSQNLVIYDDEMGKITLSLKKSYDTFNGYVFVFYIENNKTHSRELSASIYDLYINDEKVSYLTDAFTFASGKKGYSCTEIDLDSLTASMKGFKSVEGTIGIDGEKLIEIPVVVDSDAFMD